MAKMKLTQRISRAMELPADAALPVPRLEITGQNDILVTGNALLLEYAPDCIRLDRGECQVTIRGVDLGIAAMDKLGMQIYGQIITVEFSS